MPKPGQPSNSSPSRRGYWCCAASRVLGIGLASHFSSRMFDKIKAYWSREQSIGYWSETHNVFFTFGWQCLTLLFFRNRRQLLWFKSSRNESNNMLGEYYNNYIAFFLSGEWLLANLSPFLVNGIEIFNLQCNFSRWLNLANMVAFAEKTWGFPSQFT